MSDPRFARFKTDPRFRPLKKHKSKVVVDDRFKSVFDKGKKGTGSARVDKYGRPVSATHDKDALHRFYRLEDDEEEDDAKPAVPDYARGAVLLESSDEEEDEEEDDQGPITLGQDSSRPIPIPFDEEAEVDLDEDNFADLDAQAAAYSKEHADDKDATAPAEETRRIAVVNLDWDHVRSVHLYKIFSSLLSSSTAVGPSKKSKKASAARGKLLHVKIYSSQFGKERIAREEKEGPPPEVFRRKKDLDDDEINEKTIYEVGNGEDYDEDALRKYQLERLRYYYAVATCDTVDAASHIFSELEGTELEKSANVFDLSFVPDEMTFDDEPRDEADETSIANYKGLEFSTDALRHSKVRLTWDEDDRERNEVTRRALTKKEIEEDDFHAYIASSSDEDEGEAANKAQSRDRLRSLLLGGANDDLPEGWGDDQGKDDDIDMQITFTSGLNKTDTQDETSIQKYQRKLKEKKQKRKERMNEQDGAEDAAEEKDILQDEFFAADSDTEKPVNAKAVKKKGSKKADKSEPAPRTEATKEELALLVSKDDKDDASNHFDLSAIIKAEKRTKGKRKKGKLAVTELDEIQEDFVIDTSDDRFKAIHEDHQFAIDPSNPSYKKTKAMAALLAKPRRHGQNSEGEHPQESRAEGMSTKPNLEKLVENVKRKSENKHSHSDRKGKRSRLA